MKPYNQIAVLLARAKQIAEHLEVDPVRDTPQNDTDVDLYAELYSGVESSKIAPVRESAAANRVTARLPENFDEHLKQTCFNIGCSIGYFLSYPLIVASTPSVGVSYFHVPLTENDDAAIEPDSLADLADPYELFAEGEVKELEKHESNNVDKDSQSKTVVLTIPRARL